MLISFNFVRTERLETDAKTIVSALLKSAGAQEKVKPVRQKINSKLYI